MKDAVPRRTVKERRKGAIVSSDVDNFEGYAGSYEGTRSNGEDASRVGQRRRSQKARAVKELTFVVAIILANSNGRNELKMKQLC